MRKMVQRYPDAALRDALTHRNGHDAQKGRARTRRICAGVQNDRAVLEVAASAYGAEQSPWADCSLTAASAFADTLT